MKVIITTLSLFLLLILSGCGEDKKSTKLHIQQVKKEFTIISQDLDQYFSEHMHYPKSNSWNWDNSDKYVRPNLKTEWLYTCSGTRITLTTPVLDENELKTLSKKFSEYADEVNIKSNRINIYLDNKPCK